MKKCIFGILVFIAFVLIIIGVKEQQNFITPEKQKPSGEISLKLGKQKFKAPYKKLGVTVNAVNIANKPKNDNSFGLASLFSTEKKTQKKAQLDVSIDTKLLAHFVVSIFPFLNLPEEAHQSFFITVADQEIKQTFNLRKLAMQLKEKASSPDESEIEIELIPEEDLSAKKEELAGKEVLIKLEGDDVPTMQWKILTDVALDKAQLKEFLENQIVPKVIRPAKNASIKQFSAEDKAVRIETDGLAQNGIAVPIEENIAVIQKAVLANTFEVFLQLQLEPSSVYNETDLDLGDMDLLAVGRSNFAGSPEGRAFNVQKGLNEKINNIIIPRNTQFSFNSFVEPISSAAGWKKALGIFNGKDLIQTLGGGLCQVSTTVYRAALLAGLPIVERKPHSLYVTYYKKFGEGLDATVFSTGPDLIFANDTPSYIFIQSYTEGDDAYVKIYGTADGRKATLQGPYRSHDIPEDKGYKPPINEIVWFRTIQRVDGQEQEEMITSRYRALPRHPAR